MNKDINLKSFLNDIDKYSKILKESYVFDDGDNIEDENSEEILLDNEDDKMDNSTFANEKINQIRSIALEGIQQFAEEVDSDEYNIFKNIWMTCDKFYTSKNKEVEDLK